MPAPYFTKLIDTFSASPGISPYQTKALTCPTPGAGMRQTIKGITLSGWLCGVSMQLRFTQGGTSIYTSVGVGATVQDANTTNFSASLSRNAPGTMARNHVETVPLYNQTIDGFNYASKVIHYYVALNFETGESQIYCNDAFTHITFNVWGGGRLFDNTLGDWQLLPASMIGYRPDVAWVPVTSGYLTNIIPVTWSPIVVSSLTPI